MDNEIRIVKLRSPGWGVPSYDLYVGAEFVGNYRYLQDARQVGKARQERLIEEARQADEDMRLEFDL